MASPDDLKFQEFEEAADLLSADPGASTNPIHKHTDGDGAIKLDLSEDEDAEEKSELLSGERPAASFWTFEYYQSFFNIDTMQVLDRIKGSLLPLPGRNFVKHHLRSNPDLYGPFWICATLVFTMAISGNFSTFLLRKGDPQYHYRPQFHKVSIAGLAVFSYSWLTPLCVWGLLQWRSTRHGRSSYSFLETVSVYGYSLFIYIPTAVLWTVPLEWLRWLLILGATAVSGAVLLLSFWPLVRDDSRPVALATLTGIVLAHALLAIGCKLYFFQTAIHTVTLPSEAPPIANLNLTHA
ncbi:protein YIPF2 [Amia ocellicauda]|uniref:protein YIPF2 n=1 Tax=Amia ocellicauda TaxID=2972642 RepID=UPI00346395A1